jgi:tetratricopeptide (TPR) repeat protein
MMHIHKEALMLLRQRKEPLLAALLLLSLLPLLHTRPLAAQDWRGRGRLLGTVTDESGAPVEGAEVTLRPGNDPVKHESAGPSSTKTDKKGHWSFLGLAQGTWGVLIEKDGFVTSEGRTTVEEEGVAKPINVKLKKADAQAAQAAQPAKDQPPSKGAQAVKLITDGNAALQQDQNAQARDDYQQALALLDPPNQPMVLRAIASTYYRESTAAKTKEEKAQKLDQAIDSLKQALAIKPDDTESLQLIVNLLVGAGREAEAQPYMAKLPQGAKVDAETLLNVGIKYYNSKQMAKAFETFNRVVTENPELPEGYYYRGLLFLNQGKTAEAKADFKKLLEIDPKNQHAAEVKEYLKDL